MDTLPVINKTYEAYKILLELNRHLEKFYRYGLGVSLENSLLSLLQELIMAKNAPKALKAGYLIRACSYQEIAILKLRAYLELDLVNKTKIFQLQGLLAEVGKMAGGWLKSLS
jgi:hypothetical protein